MSRSYINKVLFVLSLLGVQLMASAQDFDRLRFASQNIQGTGRYVGLGGAMAAIGGDVSAVKDNPAALGVFRRSELSITVDWFYDKVKPADIVSSNSVAHHLTMPQLSGVLTFQRQGRERGVLSNSIMAQYHRLNTYDRNTCFKGTYSTSQTDLMASMTNGLDYLTFYPTDSDNPYFDEEIGWLSVLGYRTAVIDTIKDYYDQYSSILGLDEKSASTLKIREDGHQDEYSLAWGMNISNTVYVGAGLNIRTYSYSKEVTYTEQFAEGGQYELRSEYSASGAGVNLNVGVIGRPVSWLRLALAAQTPTVVVLKQKNYADCYSDGVYSTDGANFMTLAESTVENSITANYSLPMRTVVGAAFQFSTRALLSLEYDYQHHFAGKNELQAADIHFLKVGAEVAFRQHYFVQLGYAVQSPFLFGDKAEHYVPAYNTVRTDTDYKNQWRSHYFSTGFGMRFPMVTLHWTYQLGLDRAKQYAYYGQAEPFNLRATTNRLVFSVAWTYR